MKKILLTTTALVCAGIISAPALADSPNDSFNTKPKPAGIELSLGGYLKSAFGYVNSDVVDSREYAVKHDAEIYFTGETTLENGLTVGARIETETGGSVNRDEQFAYLRGSFGEVRAGQEDDVRRLLSVQAPQGSHVFASTNPYISFKDMDSTLTNVAGAAGTGAGASNALFTVETDTVASLAGSDDSAKVIYFTPSFNGLTLGASFAPSQGDTGANNSGNVSLDTTAGDELSIAALYDAVVNGVGVTASAGYTGNDAGTAAGFTEDSTAYALGLVLAYNGWSFGGSYGSFNDAGGVKNDDVDTYDVGVTYETGPYVVGVAYTVAQYDLTTTTEIDVDTLIASGTYALGQGIALTGAIEYNEIDQDGVASTAESTAVMVGTDITF